MSVPGSARSAFYNEKTGIPSLKAAVKRQSQTNQKPKKDSTPTQDESMQVKKPKHNFYDDVHRLPESANSMIDYEIITPRKEILLTEGEDIKVIKVSPSFLKSYKPMMQSKGSNFQIGRPEKQSSATQAKTKSGPTHKFKVSPSTNSIYSDQKRYESTSQPQRPVRNQPPLQSQKSVQSDEEDFQSMLLKEKEALAISSPQKHRRSNEKRRLESASSPLEAANPFEKEEERLDNLLQRMEGGAPQRGHFESLVESGALSLKQELNYLQRPIIQSRSVELPMNRVDTPIKPEVNIDEIEGKKEDLQETNFGLIDIQIKSDENLRQKEDVDDQDCVQTPRPFNESDTALATTEERNKKNSSKTEEEYLKLKALVTIPYLPPLEPSISSKPVYTLVLDLDETLIHLECDEEGDPLNPDDEGIYYLIRPGTIRFLNELAKYFELVIFTAAMPDYADWILDNIDRKQIVSHRLYRQHTTPHEDYAIKDLRNLGRPLERTLIIDNLAENFLHTTPDNGIWVESWYDDMEDTVLELLTPFLQEIVTSGLVPDVRKLLTKNVKEQVIYRCLEEGKPIPSIEELLKIANQ